MAYTFNTARRDLLAKRWAQMKVLRQQAEIEREAKAIVGKAAIYRQAEAATNGVPWWMIGVIDAREGGISHLGARHLHCGDPLTNYTTHVPAGRPAVGHGPPFTWLESAIDALKMKNFHTVGNWTIERVLHELEPYNGLGYYNKGIPSPYIWSCTNLYDPPYGPGGKYVADHVFDSKAVDQQIGCAPLIARILELEKLKPSTETTTPTPPPTSKDSIKKAKVPIGTTAGGVVIAAGTAAQNGVPFSQIIPAIIIVVGIAAMIFWIWHRHRQ